MEKYEGLDGREKLAENLTEKFGNLTAASVTLIQAGCGQGKSFVIDQIINNLKNSKNMNIFVNDEDELVSQQQKINKPQKDLSSFDVSIGIREISLGIGVGWDNNHSNYNKIRNLLSSKFKKNTLICINNISEVSDALRFFITSIIENVQKLEEEFKKRIFILITDEQDVYRDVVYKYTNSHEILNLPRYTLKDTETYLNKRGIIKHISCENLSRIFELSQGNLDLAYFLYNEIMINQNNYLLTLQDVVAKRIAIIKSQGERYDISEKKMEQIVFSASLALKKFSAPFIGSIVEDKSADVECGLEIAKNEALLEKDIKKFYNFISADIQNHISKITIKNHENILLSYYNYYTKNEQDDYYLRAYYIYKYTGIINRLSFSLFMLAFLAANKMEDTLRKRSIEKILEKSRMEESYKNMFDVIKKIDSVMSGQLSFNDLNQAYKNIIYNYDWELAVKAELTCEYFHYIYKNTDVLQPQYRNILNECINYAMNELIIDTQCIDSIVPVDETIIRLKIIYEISPCILDQLNDYNEFCNLYNKSKELSNTCGIKHNGIGKYIENVFNRKAFLFANQASCGIYYQNAKRFFRENEIWVEYYITMVCEAGTDIVIQQFDDAIKLCNSAELEANEKDIQLPQIEKLYNNRIIAEFFLQEQTAKTTTKRNFFARIAIKELKELITGAANATQFVIYTNLCSLFLYTDNDKQYLRYKHKLENLCQCKDIADIRDESIDDFYRYYFAWFELYRKIKNNNWDDALESINLLDGFIPALFRKQEIFWDNKNTAVKELIVKKKDINAYDFCHNLVKTKRYEQTLSKFFYRGLMLSDLQYTSYL